MKIRKKLMSNVPQMVSSVAVLLVLGTSQQAYGGWSGFMNGAGYGSASVNVRAGYTALSNSKGTTGQNPSVGIPSGLPSGASSFTYSSVSGLPGYIWRASSGAYYGDSTDNLDLARELANRGIDLGNLGNVAGLDMISSFLNNTLTIHAFGDPGSAFWVRGYVHPTGDFDNDGDTDEHDMDVLPIDVPATELNETIQFLLAHGATEKFNELFAGPFDLGFGESDACPLTINLGPVPPGPPIPCELDGLASLSTINEINSLSTLNDNNSSPYLILFTDGLVRSSPLPDSGSTLTLLAMGLVGLGLIPRKK